MRASHSEFVELNGLRHHVRRWGNPEAPLLVMLHGWMDVSATFQFVVDELVHDWNIVAPDWSGFGLSAWNPCGYSLLQYAADLDRFLDLYSPSAPAPIVAHSMGANICNIYVAARPQRVSHFVNIEGYAPVPGFFEGTLGQVVGRWLNHMEQPGQGRPYADFAKLAERLSQSNKRLTYERAEFLASQLGICADDGQVYISADPLTRFFSPISLHREQLIELWQDIQVPVLCIRGGRSFISKAFENLQGDLAERIAALPNGAEALLAEGTHNLHHEYPREIAHLIEELLAK